MDKCKEPQKRGRKLFYFLFFPILFRTLSTPHILYINEIANSLQIKIFGVRTSSL